MEASAAAPVASSSSRRGILCARICQRLIPCTSGRPGPAAVFLQSSYHTPPLTLNKPLLNSGPRKTCLPLPLKEKLEEAFPSHHINAALRKLWQHWVVMRYGYWWADAWRSCKEPLDSVENLHSTTISRRLCIVSLLLVGAGERTHAFAAADDGLDPCVDLELEPFTDQKEGFKLLKPAHWSKVSKAGATVLFEDPITKGNNLGVVVSPVKISSLQKFGSLQDVATKLIEAERKKAIWNN